MLRLIARYTNLFVITIFMLVLFSFALPYFFPGELITNLTGITPESDIQKLALQEAYGVDASLYTQFNIYLSNLFAGNWGDSAVTGQSLYSEIWLTFPATIELAIYSVAAAILFGVPIGFLSGLKHHNPVDFSVVTFSIVGYSFPVFWLALIFITIFCLQLEWLPTSGRIDLLFDVPVNTGFILIDIGLSDMNNKSQAYINAFQHLVLPTFSVAIITSALFIRFVRRSTMEVMEKAYIVAAKSRGFTKRQIFFKHGLKNALIPILPLLALQVSTLITNVMVVETIFSWPGIGKWLIEAIYQQDYPAIRIGMLVVSLFVMSITLSVEFITRALDPARERGENAEV